MTSQSCERRQPQTLATPTGISRQSVDAGHQACPAHNRHSVLTIGAMRPLRVAHNRHYAFLVVPGHGLLVTRLTGCLTVKLEGYEN